MDRSSITRADRDPLLVKATLDEMGVEIKKKTVQGTINNWL